MSLTINAIQDAVQVLLENQLAPISRDLGSLKVDMSALKQNFSNLEQKFSNLEQKFSNIENEVSHIDRSVKAIESLPVPYGRPRNYHSATELQSVSKPVRRRQSYLG